MVCCIICDKVKQKGDSKKYRFTYESSATEFFNAAHALRDEVYIRIADIGDWSALIASDIYYHKDCKRCYMLKYKNLLADCLLCDQKVNHKYKLGIESIEVLLTAAQEKNDTKICEQIRKFLDDECATSSKPFYAHVGCRLSYIEQSEMLTPEIFKAIAVPLVEDMLKQSYFLSISDIRDQLEEIFPNKRFYNQVIKDFLSGHFGDRISFCKPYRANQASIVYPSDISKDQMVKRMQNFNVLRNAGRLIRSKLLKEVDFGLEDSFNDKEDLVDSWESTRMPESLIEFFSGLMNMSKADLIRPNEMEDKSESEEKQQTTWEADSDSETDFEDCSADEDNQGHDGPRIYLEKLDMRDDCEEEYAAEPHKDPIKKRRKRRKKPKSRLAQSLFQTLYYIIHGGKKKPPQHIMLSHAVNNSKELITILHRLGYTVSYSEYLRGKKKLAGYNYKRSKECACPLAEHFNEQDFLIASFDNFDHEDASSLSGKFGNHDTMVVLYQNESPIKPGRKGKVSQYGQLPTIMELNEKMECQKLLPYNFNKATDKQIPLPTDFVATPNPPYEDSKRSEILSAARTLLSPVNNDENLSVQPPSLIREGPYTLPTWSGSHALTSKGELTLKKIAFHPVIPHPVTQYETVYTVLRNFGKLAERLKQKTLPFVCDEGVYHIVVDIYKHNPEIFRNLFPMLGTFQMASLRVAGKF